MKRAARQRVFATANSMLHAARECGLDAVSFRQVSAAKARDVIRQVRSTFTSGGAANRRSAWLWEELSEPRASRSSPRTVSALLGLGPANMAVFLLVEDRGAKATEPLWVFEATLAAATTVLENHYGLEYYIVPRSFEWLVAENHHDMLIAAGPGAASVLARVSH